MLALRAAASADGHPAVQGSTLPRDAGSRQPPAHRKGAGPRSRSALAIVLGVVLVNIGLWWASVPQVQAPDAPSRLQGMAYNGFTRWASPLDGRYPDAATQARDLQRIAAITDRLRTYSASELPNLPALAEAHRLRVTVGVWLDAREAHNRREIDAAVLATRKHEGVERIIAGNETQLHGSLSAGQLRSTLRELRSRVRVPVSTAEPWHVWLAQPWLAQEVDFITVHLLPYWEGVPVEHAVDYALQRYQQLRERFPGKRIVIGEVGWPSAGERIGAARASLANQALFIRQFTARAPALDYFLMEAIDQPWKRINESRVGGHWGVWDVQREAKFALQGPLEADPDWWLKALAASALAAVLTLPLLYRFGHMRVGSRVALALAVQAVASGTVLSAMAVLEGYLWPSDMLLVALLLPAVILMTLLLVAQLLEFFEIHAPSNRPPPQSRKPWRGSDAPPMVSVHLACCNESPQMVMATIDSLLALQWPALEIIVVDNNTRDAALWQPVQAHVQMRRAQLASMAASAAGAAQSLPVNLRFVHLPQWPGFKAGALNHALALTDARAQWVGVVDADYLVSPDWLQAVAGHFEDPVNLVVQCPQAHREFGGNRLARMMNFEFDSFFRVGMHHRAARNALVQHGTMTLIRRDALEAAGAWDTGCICEDTELGLRLLAAGGRAIYVDEVLGTGLLPADFAAYQRQRERWAQGGMQILHKHWRALCGVGSTGRDAARLDHWQRAHFLAGWLPWLADALHLVFSIVALGWSTGVLLAPRWFELPSPVLAWALLAACALRWGIGLLLHLRCVTPRASDAWGAMVAAAGLSHAVARGVFRGLLARRAVFHVTRKGQASGRRVGHFSLSAEALLLTGLLCSGAALWGSGWPRGDGLTAWTLILALQSLPYLAACCCQALCAHRLAARPRAAAQPS